MLGVSLLSSVSSYRQVHECTCMCTVLTYCTSVRPIAISYTLIAFHRKPDPLQLLAGENQFCLAYNEAGGGTTSILSV